MSEFEVGDIVWGKVEGHEWWPAKTVQIQHSSLKSDTKVVVKFFAEEKHATLPVPKIKSFDEEFDTYSKTKNGRLLKAIQLAKKAAAKKVVQIL